MSTAVAVIECIHIEQLEVQSRIGVPESERAEPQRLTLNITLWPEPASHDLGDEITNTINYSAVAESARQIAAHERFRLIETLAETIASQLLARFRSRKIAVEVRKFVLSDAKFVAVTARQEREQH